MKKVILSVVSLAFLNSVHADGNSSEAVQFEGLKYGLGFALASKHIMKKSNKDSAGKYIGVKGYETQGEYNHGYGFHGKLMLEKVVNYDGVLIGGEFFAAYDFFNPKHQSSRTILEADGATTITLANNPADTLTTKSKKTISAGIVTKIGLQKESAWVHGNLGLDVARFSNSISASNDKGTLANGLSTPVMKAGSFSNSGHDTRLGMIVGAGIDVKLQTIVIAFDANYHHYFGGQSVKLDATKNDNTTLTLTDMSFKNRGMNFNFSVKMPI